MSPAEIRLISNLPILGIIIVVLFYVAQKVVKMEVKMGRMEEKLNFLVTDRIRENPNHASFT